MQKKNVADMISNLFNKFFDGGSSEATSFPANSQKLEGYLSGKMTNELDKGNFLNAFMLEGSRQGLESTRNQVLKGFDANKNADASADAITSDINSSVDNLKRNEEVKDVHADYHNHDSKALDKAQDFAADALEKGLKEYGMKSGQPYMVAAGYAVGFVKDHLKSRPESPAEKSGLNEEMTPSPTKILDKAMSKNKDNGIQLGM